jgi:hypothetical protein
MSTTKKYLLAPFMLFLSIGSAHPGLTQQVQQDGWETVQSGVWQRHLGDGGVETFVSGVPGFTWKIEDLRRQLQKLRTELRAHPTPELRKAIANHRKAIANAKRALDLAREAEALGDELILPKAGCVNFAYDAAASHKTDVQGVWASSNAAFRANCGSATGQAYAYAFAKTTVNGAETTETVTDGPRSGSNVSASAYASRNGGSPCESYAYGEMVSYDLNPSSYSKSVTNSACPAPPSPNQAPVADFTFACMDLACSFNGSSSTGTGLSYSWSFGDSTPNGTGVTTSHFYPNVSDNTAYTATLTVTDSQARQSSKSKTVIVNNHPLPAAHSYFTVAPCRVLDTRNTTILTNAQPRVVNIAGLCGIPSTAQAVAFNVTAVSPTGSGKFRLYPGDVTITNPALWPSSVTFEPATSPRGNSAVIKLATNGVGTLGIYPEVSGSPGQVHLVLDVQGYFSTDTSPAAGAQGPLGFQTLSPCRVAWPSSPLTAGTVTNFTAQGVCGVPAGAAAVSLHAGVAQPAYSGYLTLFPSNISTPGVATLNFPSGTLVLRNSALVKLAPATPDFSVYFGATAGATVSVHFDVNGYFKSDAPLKYYPLMMPCRPVSSQLLTADTVRTFQIQGNCGVPAGAKAALVRLVVANPTSSGDVIVYPSDLPLSAVAVSAIKFDANEPGLSMNTIVPLSTLAADLAASPSDMTAGGTVVLSIDVFGYFQ